MPRKVNLPNLAPWDISFKPGEYVKHAGCGGRIVGETYSHQGQKVRLECARCSHGIGRRATNAIKDRAIAELSPIIGLGRQLQHRLYFRLPEKMPEEVEDEI